MQTILVIEDAETIRENTREILELAGYKIFTAKNGREGLKVAKKNKPDLILCDILMPILDGYAVLRALKNLPKLAGTRFVFFTAKSEKSDVERGWDHGADGYIVKPFECNDLIMTIIACLKKKGLRSEKKLSWKKNV